MAFYKFKGFIFSLDAFVAFSLALTAIYSLIFFSSIPSAYYNTITQAHYLSKDILLSLSQTKCTNTKDNPLYPQCPKDENISVLDFLVFRSNDQLGDTSFFAGRFIPIQFGYKIEKSDDGTKWFSIYDTGSGKTIDKDLHNDKKQKLSVSSYIIAFNYNDQIKRPANPYSYNTCNGGQVVCNAPAYSIPLPNPNMKIIRLTIFI